MQRETVIAFIISLALCSSCSLRPAQTSERLLPTDTPQPTFTATPVPTDTASPSNTPKPTDTPRPTDTPEPTNTPTSTATPKPTDTPQPTATPTPEPTSVTHRIDSYLDQLDPTLRQSILDSVLADQQVSWRERSLVFSLAAFPAQSQTQIVHAGLIDENYASRDPNQILENLATPQIIVFYLANHFTYEAQWPVIYKPASMAISEGKGGCIRYAQIAAEALRRHGYSNSWNMGVDITSERGHNVAAFQNPADGLYYVITNGTGRGDQQGAVLLGPYGSFREAGEDVERRGYSPKQGDIRLLDPAAIQGPRGDILDFPWMQAP